MLLFCRLKDVLRVKGDNSILWNRLDCLVPEELIGPIRFIIVVLEAKLTCPTLSDLTYFVLFRTVRDVT